MLTRRESDVLFNAFKDYLENNGVISVDYQMELRRVGYNPDRVAERFSVEESPSTILKYEHIHNQITVS
jgi:hypothetical protein